MIEKEEDERKRRRDVSQELSSWVCEEDEYAFGCQMRTFVVDHACVLEAQGWVQKNTMGVLILLISSNV